MSSMRRICIYLMMGILLSKSLTVSATSFIVGIDSDPAYYKNNTVILIPAAALMVGESCYVSDIAPNYSNTSGWMSYETGYVTVSAEGEIKALRVLDVEEYWTKSCRLVNKDNQSIYIWVYDPDKIDLNSLQIELEKGTDPKVIERKLIPGTMAYKTFSIVKQISEQIIDSDMNEISKVQAVIRYVVKHVKYDYEYEMREYTAYDALANNLSTCAGYAQAVSMLLNYNGIRAMSVYGNGFQEDLSMSHEWNLVQVDGNWYHVDTTWDATDLVPGYMVYNLVSDKQITKDHPVWASSLAGQLPYPSAPKNYKFSNANVTLKDAKVNIVIPNDPLPSEKSNQEKKAIDASAKVESGEEKSSRVIVGVAIGLMCVVAYWFWRVRKPKLNLNHGDEN